MAAGLGGRFAAFQLEDACVPVLAPAVRRPVCNGRRLAIVAAAVLVLGAGAACALGILGRAAAPGPGPAAPSTLATTRSITTTATSTTTMTTGAYVAWSCKSSLNFASGVKMYQKGMCLDDTTFKDCPEKITALWPNTAEEKIKAFRIFKSWHPDWGDDTKRDAAWSMLRGLFEANNARVLIGVEVTCDHHEDMRNWEQTLKFLKFIGKEHVMGVAIGNDMELYDEKLGPDTSCVQPPYDLWSDSNTSYIGKIEKIADDLDDNGFSADVKLTAVFGGAVKAGYPFVDSPHRVATLFRKEWASVSIGSSRIFKQQTLLFTLLCAVGTILGFRKCSKKYKDRWVYSFNEYPFWALACGAYPQPTPDGWLGISASMLDYKKRIEQATGNSKPVIWMTETGWSSSDPNGWHLPRCSPRYCSTERLQGYYQGFRSWDPGFVQWSFYFTIRDSSSFHVQEGFGLVRGCEDTQNMCKLQKGAVNGSNDVAQMS